MQEPEKHSNPSYELDHGQSGEKNLPPPYSPDANVPAPYPPASGSAYYPPASGSAPYPPASGSAYYPPASGSAPYPPVSGSAYYPPTTGPMQGPGYQPYYPNSTGPGPQQPLICQPPSVMMVNSQTPVAATRPVHSDYLAWSILNCLCCCWPLGIAAIVYSCKTRSDIGDYDEGAAARHSRTARDLNISALVIGLILNILYIVFYWKYTEALQKQYHYSP